MRWDHTHLRLVVIRLRDHTHLWLMVLLHLVVLLLLLLLMLVLHQLRLLIHLHLLHVVQLLHLLRVLLLLGQVPLRLHVSVLCNARHGQLHHALHPRRCSVGVCTVHSSCKHHGVVLLLRRRAMHARGKHHRMVLLLHCVRVHHRHPIRPIWGRLAVECVRVDDTRRRTMLSSHLLHHHLRHRRPGGRVVGVIRVLVGGRDGRAVCLYLGHGLVSDNVLIDVPKRSCQLTTRSGCVRA